MARKDPSHRASAAQMLLHLFNGEGLTTARSEIPPIELLIPAKQSPAPIAGPSTPSSAANNRVRALPWLADEADLLSPMPRAPDYVPGLFPLMPREGVVSPRPSPLQIEALRLRREGIAKRGPPRLRPNLTGVRKSRIKGPPRRRKHRGDPTGACPERLSTEWPCRRACNLCSASDTVF